MTSAAAVTIATSTSEEPAAACSEVSALRGRVRSFGSSVGRARRTRTSPTLADLFRRTDQAHDRPLPLPRPEARSAEARQRLAHAGRRSLRRPRVEVRKPVRSAFGSRTIWASLANDAGMLRRFFPIDACEGRGVVGPSAPLAEGKDSGRKSDNHRRR